MSQIITINDTTLEQLTYTDVPVVTFQQIADVHGISVRNVHRAFERHKPRFAEGKHYFRLDFAEASELPLRVEVSPNGLFLFTEKGYLLLTKPMRDEQSWQVQERMIDDYFTMKSVVSPPPRMTPGEVIATCTLARDFLTSLGMLEDRDKLFFRDYTMNALQRTLGESPEASGQRLLTTGGEPSCTVADRVLALAPGLSSRQRTRVAIAAGRQAALEYRRAGHGLPQTFTQYIDGAARRVNFYPAMFLDTIDACVQIALAKETPRPASTGGEDV